jgi:hypothetical protein
MRGSVCSRTVGDTHWNLISITSDLVFGFVLETSILSKPLFLHRIPISHLLTVKRQTLLSSSNVCPILFGFSTFSHLTSREWYD